MLSSCSFCSNPHGDELFSHEATVDSILFSHSGQSLWAVPLKASCRFRFELHDDSAPFLCVLLPLSSATLEAASEFNSISGGYRGSHSLLLPLLAPRDALSVGSVSTVAQQLPFLSLAAA